MATIIKCEWPRCTRELMGETEAVGIQLMWLHDTQVHKFVVIEDEVEYCDSDQAPVSYIAQLTATARHTQCESEMCRGNRQYFSVRIGGQG